MSGAESAGVAVPGSAVRAAEEPLLAAGRGPELMRTAAWALAERAAALLRARGPVAGATVAALVGSGNNGGDALFALAFLRRRGVAAVAVPVRRDDTGVPRWHTEGWAALEAAGGRRAAAVPAHAALVVDGMLGTGFTGTFALPAPARSLPAGALVLACDVPSGLDADTGQVRGEALRADATVTFGALKTGLLLGEGPALAGEVHALDLGLGTHLPASPGERLLVTDEAAARAAHPAPAPDAHKYTRGLVAVAAGSARYPGAAVLSCAGALHAGAGLVHHAGPQATRDRVLDAHPEALVSAEGPEPARADAWVAGPGLDTGEDARHRWVRVLAALAERPDAALVADASALDLVTAAELRVLREAGTPVVLTPHAGEWARLRQRLPAAGADAVDPVAGLRAWSAAHGSTVLLKGPRTLVVQPDGEAHLVSGGGPELAMGGTGDVLCGAVGAVLAADVARRARARRSGQEPGPSPTAALAAAAAWLHACAGAAQAREGRLTTATLPAALGAATARLWWAADEDEDGGTRR